MHKSQGSRSFQKMDVPFHGQFDTVSQDFHKMSAKMNMNISKYKEKKVTTKEAILNSPNFNNDHFPWNLNST